MEHYADGCDIRPRDTTGDHQAPKKLR